MRIECTLDYGALPKIVGDAIYVSEDEIPSRVIIDTPDLVVVDHLPVPMQLYLFREGPRRITWNDLTDDERLLIRSFIKNIGGGNMSYYQYGGYTDDRYYTLEALSGH